MKSQEQNHAVHRDAHLGASLRPSPTARLEAVDEPLPAELAELGCSSLPAEELPLAA